MRFIYRPIIKKEEKQIRFLFEKMLYVNSRLGTIELIRLISQKLLGSSRISGYLSMVDLRNSKVKLVSSPFEFLLELYPELNSKEVENVLSEFSKVEEEIVCGKRFPESFNAGRALQSILYAVIQLKKSKLLIETGTGNGVSTTVAGRSMQKNGGGQVISIDVVEILDDIVDAELKQFVSLLQLKTKSMTEKQELVHAASSDTSKMSIFLHDGDHSFVGQYLDYEIAMKCNFDLLISDDIDASLAFVTFVSSLNLRAVAMLDGCKIIGACLLR